MYAFSDDIRTVLWFAVIPAAIAVAILVFGVKEPPPVPKEQRVPIKAAEIARLGRFYWFVVGAGAVWWQGGGGGGSRVRAGAGVGGFAPLGQSVPGSRWRFISSTARTSSAAQSVGQLS